MGQLEVDCVARALEAESLTAPDLLVLAAPACHLGIAVGAIEQVMLDLWESRGQVEPEWVAA